LKVSLSIGRCPMLARVGLTAREAVTEVNNQLNISPRRGRSIESKSTR